MAALLAVALAGGQSACGRRPVDDAIAKCAGQDSGKGSADVCYAQAAAATLTTEPCALIERPSDQAKCVSDVASRLASPDLCEKAPKPAGADNCFSEFARDMWDASVCGRISASSVRDECLFSLATRRVDFDACADVADPRRRADCQGEVARKRHDLALCRRVEATRQRDECLVSLVGSVPDPDAICGGVDSSFDRDTCYRRAAHEDPSWCDRSTAAKRCYTDLFSNLTDRDVCATLADPEIADECVAAVGRMNREGALCETVRDRGRRDECWRAVAGPDDPAACLRIDDQNVRAQCAAASWRSLEDPRVCALLPEADRLRCKAATTF
jgi:hypothetical protein